MAWVEQRRGSWRARYRAGGVTQSVSGFRSETEAENFAADMATDCRRGVWIDPPGRRCRSPTGRTGGSRRSM